MTSIIDKAAQAHEAVALHGTPTAAAQALGIPRTTLNYHLSKLPSNFEAKGTNVSYLDEEGHRVSRRYGPTAVDKHQAHLDAIEKFFEGMKKTVSCAATPRHKRSISNEDLLTAYVIGDAHFGCYAWGRETGGDNVDTDITKRDLQEGLKTLIGQGPDAHTALVCNLGDVFHVDGLKAVTPNGGNLLDHDNRLSYTIEVVGQLFRYAIDRMLDKHQEVVVVNLRGNHDESISIMFNKLIDAFYLNEPRVSVIDNTPKLISMQWGRTGLYWHHSDRIDHKRLYEQVTRDHRELWGSTDYSYMSIGHRHHAHMQELGGLYIECFQTLSGADAWHAASGYGAGRSITSITYSKKYGEVARIKTDLRMIRDQLKEIS